MPLLNYGSTLGLSYVHDYKSMNDEMARQEQLNAQKKAQDTQKSMWIADKLKKGKTYTKFDSDQLTAYSQQVYKEVGNIISNDDWETDPMAITKILEYGDKLLDNEHVQRSARVHDAQTRWVKDMSDPKFAEDEDAAEYLKLKGQEFSNYDQQGNGDGIQGAPVKEFTYSSPSLFNLQDEIFAAAKNIATGERAYVNSVGHGTQEYVKNSAAVAQKMIEGTYAKQIDRAYQEHIETTKEKVTKLDWLKENLEASVSLDMTFGLNPQSSGGSGSGASDKSTFIPVQEFVKDRLKTNDQKLMASNSNFIDTDIQHSNVFIKGAVVPVQGENNKYQYQTSSRNGILATRMKDGKMYAMPNMNGKNVQITPLNQIRTVKMGKGVVARYATAKMFIKDPPEGAEGRNPELKNLVKYGGYYPGHPKFEEGGTDQWSDDMREVKDKDGNVIGVEVSALLPIEFGGEKDYTYNQAYLGQASLEAGHVAEASYNSALMNESYGKPNGYQFQTPGGIVYEVQNGVPKRIR